MSVKNVYIVCLLKMYHKAFSRQFKAIVRHFLKCFTRVLFAVLFMPNRRSSLQIVLIDIKK